MKVRMKVEMSGTRNSQPWPKVGEEIDLPDDEATSYCAAGLAEPASAEVAEVETATPDDDSEQAVPSAPETATPVDDSEKAVQPAPRRGRPPGSKNKPRE